MESKPMGLPAAWQERIEVDAKARWPLHVNEPENEKLRAAYEVGAMVYAPWLYTCQTNYAALKERYDNILATEDGHLSKTENVWQSGYAAGHEAATDKMGRDCDKTVDNALHAARNDCQRKMNELQKENIEQYAALQAKCERYEKLLQDIHAKAKEGIFPHVPVETIGAQKCVEIDAMLNEALSAGEGEKDNAKEGVIRILLSQAADVSKDAESAKAYLESEGIDIEKLEDNAKFVSWLAELSKLLHNASDGQPVKINQVEARKWFDDGMTPYQCFRETWNME